MSLSKYLAGILKSTSPAHVKMGEDVSQLARWSTLTSLRHRMPLHAETMVNLDKMIAKADTHGKAFAPHPHIPPYQVDDLHNEFMKKIEDQKHYGRWTDIGQPSKRELNILSEDYATPAADTLNLSSNEIDTSMKKLQGIYGFLGENHRNFPDAMIENKIPGFTEWMKRKRLGK